MTGLKPTVIDIEASGLGRGSYPIEIGYVRGDGAAGCFLIRPQSHWTHWDTEAQALHGITRDILRRYGHPPEHVASALNLALTGVTVYSDAWGNDLSWLGLLFEETGIVQQFRLESLRGLLGEDHLARWAETKQAVLNELNLDRHRASADALVLQMTYARVTQRLD
ncbi:MAG: hypothetical protein AAF493_18750 [Pseudomonadota bacterium]